MSFAEASAVTPLGGGRFHAEIAPGWDIAGATNGGYLLGLTARAAGAAADGRRPVTTTAHYLAPVAAGPAEVQTEVVRAGRRFTTVRATLVAGDRAALSLLATFGIDWAEPGDDLLVDGAPPELPPADACPPTVPTESFPPPFVGRIEQRLHPDDAGFSSGRARTRGWFALRDGEPIDAYGLLLAADALPPTIFNAGLPVAWTPTLELTVHVRATPSPGPLACTFTTRFVTGGLLEADGEVWDGSGRLVAQSRQLALVPR